jgi:hypothetical protein
MSNPSFDYPVENNFTYHAPKGDQPHRYETLREEAKELAKTIIKFCPQSPETTLALRSLEVAIFWANASIARNPDKLPFS